MKASDEKKPLMDRIGRLALPGAGFAVMLAMGSSEPTDFSWLCTGLLSVGIPFGVASFLLMDLPVLDSDRDSGFLSIVELLSRLINALSQLVCAGGVTVYFMHVEKLSGLNTSPGAISFVICYFLVTSVLRTTPIRLW